MTIATVQAVSTEFLDNPKPEVLVIKGEWGSGKTYAWRKIVESNTAPKGLKKYSYLSLFGFSSVSELPLSVFSKTQNFDAINEAYSFDKWRRVVGLPSGIGNFSFHGFSISGALSGGVEQFSKRMMRDTVVCLDDFERCSIPSEEILGFISYLKEECGCKVVLIFNEGKVVKQRLVDYKNYREKVVDVELLFAPSPEEAIDLVFPKEMENYEIIKTNCLNLKITNIRILKKILNILELLSKNLKGLHSNVQLQALSTGVLLTWAEYASNDENPSLDFILQFNRILWGGEKGKNEIHEKWADKLRGYGLLYIDDFDLAISKVIRCGYIEESGLIESATKLDGTFRSGDLESSFSEAWGLFRNSFDNNQEELIKELIRTLKLSVKLISPSNLNSTVRLIRALGREEDADALIDFYIENRSNEQSIFDLNNYPFSSDVDDQNLIAKFNLALSHNIVLRSLDEVVDSLVSNNSWSQDDLDVLRNSSIHDFYVLFEKQKGDRLAKIVQACLQFRTISGLQGLAVNPIKALEQIGSQSTLNGLRVKRFGVDV